MKKWAKILISVILLAIVVTAIVLPIVLPVDNEPNTTTEATTVAPNPTNNRIECYPFGKRVNTRKFELLIHAFFFSQKTWRKIIVHQLDVFGTRRTNIPNATFPIPASTVTRSVCFDFYDRQNNL